MDNNNVNRKRIQTNKVLNNSYFSGEKSEKQKSEGSEMKISPLVSDQYSYSQTEDITLLYEREDTENKIFDIFEHSPYKEQYKASDGTYKIPKNMVDEIFNYTNTELQKIKKITATERFMAINEFYGFNYEYIYKNVITPQYKSEILNEFYTDGSMKHHMDDNLSIKLF